MRLGVVISSTLHASILTWGLWNVSAPEPFVVNKVATLPADFIPFDEFTRSIEGDKKASKKEKPAPQTTEQKQDNEPARNIGDTKIDQKSRQDAPPKPEKVEASATPPPSRDLEANELPIPEAQAKQVEEETPVPTNEISSLNEPPQKIDKQEAKDDAAKADEGQKQVELPEQAPLPTLRPRPPKAKSAKTKERQQPDEIKKAIEKASSKKEELSTEDRIAALLNKEDPSSSGKKKNTETASLGSDNSTPEQKLSRSEMDALRSAIEQCWSVPAGLSDVENMRVTVTMKLARDGTVEGRVDVQATGGEERTRRAFAESARRAVLRCAPYNLPKEKYDTWSEVVVNFDPSQMFQ